MILLLVAAGPRGGAATAGDPSFVVIVSFDVEGTQIPRDVLSSIFLREAPRWGDGRPIRAVDQSLRSTVRARFTERIHRKSLEGIQALWHRKLVSGVRPPKVKPSDAEVVAYVAENEGAIGYVAADARLPATVRVVTILD
jgi:ABC-type phosphate transport system substrate-binding protein